MQRNIGYSCNSWRGTNGGHLTGALIKTGMLQRISSLARENHDSSNDTERSIDRATLSGTIGERRPSFLNDRRESKRRANDTLTYRMEDNEGLTASWNRLYIVVRVTAYMIRTEPRDSVLHARVCLRGISPGLRTRVNKRIRESESSRGCQVSRISYVRFFDSLISPSPTSKPRINRENSFAVTRSGFDRGKLRSWLRSLIDLIQQILRLERSVIERPGESRDSYYTNYEVGGWDITILTSSLIKRSINRIIYVYSENRHAYPLYIYISLLCYIQFIE